MFKRFSRAILLAIVALIVAATPVLAAYYATYFVTESNGNSYDMMGVIGSSNNDWMADNGFMESDALDTRVETMGGLEKPHLVTDDKTLTAIPVLPNSQTSLYFTTGNADLVSMPIIPGYNGYVTTADAPAIELGDIFSVLFDGWVDTSVLGGDLVQKNSAVGVTVTDDEEITGIVYFEDPVDVTPITFGAWTDVDVSAYVPSYATGVAVHLWASAMKDMNVRMNGSGDNRWDSNIEDHAWTFIGIDSNDVFEVYLEDNTCYCYVVGYTGTGFTYNLNGVDKSLGVALAWTDIDCSTEAPDAVGLIWEVDNTDPAGVAFGFRQNGSGDNRHSQIHANSSSFAVVGCDASQICEGYVMDLDGKFYLIGYITGGVTFKTNADDKSLAGVAAWTDIDCSTEAPDATHLVFEVCAVAAGPDTYGLRRNGSGEDIYEAVEWHYWAIVECDSNQVVEGKIDNVGVDFFLVGYFTSDVRAPYEHTAIGDGITSDEYPIILENGDRADFDDYANDANIAVNTGMGMIPVRLLDEIELAAPVASVTFSDIDVDVARWDAMAGVTSRHLVVVVNAASADAVAERACLIRLNGDTGANYNRQRLYGANAAAVASRDTAVTYLDSIMLPGTTYANSYGGGVVLFPAAFLTTNHKSTLAFGGSVEERVQVVAGRWADTSAIDTILLYASAGNFATGSTFQLGVVDERYLVDEQYNTGADFLPVFDLVSGEGNDLCAIGYARSDRAAWTDSLYQELNNDNIPANYFYQTLRGQGGAASASQGNTSRIANALIGDTATANAFGAFYVNYSQYAEITNYVHTLTWGGCHEDTTGAVLEGTSSRWNDVSAITRIEYIPGVGANFKAGSLFSLYRVPRYLINRQELAAPAATVTFNNIPQGYEALQLNIYGRSSKAAVNDEIVNISYNTDVVAANYDTQVLSGVGAVVAAVRNAADLGILSVTAAGEGANEFAGGIITIPQYAKADRHKHAIVISGLNENAAVLLSERWEDTDPITRIDLTLAGANNFVAGSIFELVGVMPSTEFSLWVDGEVKGASDGAEIDVNDNGWDYVWMGGNSIPYTDYIKVEISGVDTIWYQPNDMIIGTVLPDRQGVAQDGAFTWGANPAGVVVALGAMISDDQPTPGVSPEEAAIDIMPPQDVGDWFEEPDVGGILLANPLRELVTMLSDNSTLTEIQAWRLYALAFILLVTVAVAKSIPGHLVVTGMACGATIGGMVVLTIFPLWALVFAIGAIIGGAVAERSPSL